MGAIRTRQVMLSLRRRRVQWPAAVAVSALMGALVIAPEAATASTATGPSCTDTGGYRTCVYGFTGNVDSWTVPAGLTSPTVTVDLRGASGGDGRTAKGGNGAFVEVKMNLAAGDTLSFLAGSQGASFTPTQYLGSFAGVSGFRSGGFPDGGDAGLRSTNDTSAGGGGGSTLLVVKRAGTSVNDFVADAAGGGGAGGDGGAGYWMTKVGAVPTGGAGGAGDAAGTAGGSSTDPSYAAATGGNPGSQGTLDAVGIGGAGVSGCVAGGGLSNPGANGVTLDLTVPTYGDGGHGGLGYTGDPRPVGDGGGGGGGYRGGGGGSAGGTCYLPVGSTSPYDYTAAGGGGAGGASAVDSAEVVSQFSATRDKHGDGSVSITFAVGDITPPTTTIDSAPTDPTDKTDATLFFHGADTGGSGIDHFECSLDTAAFVTCTSPVTYTGLATGAHQVRVRAVDGNGNTDPTPATASWTFVDTTPPHTSLDSVPPATIYVPSATVHFSGTDNSDPDGIARFECSLDGADFSTCTSPATFDGLSIGDHTIEVRAVDRGGNIDPTPATTSFTVSAATPPSACTVSGTSTTCTYSALDLPYWTFTVPAKVVSLHVVADGARGGNNGGNGGRAVATVAVTPGEVLRVYLGGHGQSGNSDCRTGGANGGGAGACLPSPPGPSISGGGGGGASDVRRAPYGLGDRLVVGAGGGGGDVYLTQPGGAGGGVEGAPGSGTLPGSGGTQTAGGAVGTQSCSGSDSAGSSGEFGLGGNGAYCPDPSGFGSIGGGGGGGWYGGGGAGSDPHGESSGGGGGSSYAVPSATGVTLITGGGSTYDGRVQLTYTLDTVAPSVTVEQAATQADPTSASTIHFTATFSEPVTGLTASQFVVGGTAPGAAVTALTEAAPGDGTTWDVEVGDVTSAGTVTLTLPAGAVTDLASNPSTASTSTDDTVTYQPDTTPPTTTITSAPVDPTDSSSASFSFTADDGTGSGVASSQCSLDGTAFSACSSPVGYPQLVDGSHTFRVRSVDAAGNVENPVSYTWTVDTVAPVTTITSTPADPSKTAAPTFAFTVDGTGSGVAGSECSLDGAAFTACTSPVAYSGLADGAHTFQVRSTDAAGNTEQPRSYGWSIDTVAPTATITSSPPDPTADTSASVDFTTADVGSGVARVQCSLDTAAWAYCTSPVSYTALPDGRHTVRVRATDRAANVGEPASVSWLVDTVAPTLAPTISPSPTYLGDVATVTPNATDDGSGVASALCGTPATDSAGYHSVVCTATDHAGNTTSIAFPYLVQYRISAFPSPVPDSKWKAGQTVPIKATLSDGAGTALSDAQSEALAADCRVQFMATGVQPILTPVCMKYDTAKHQFVYPWHLDKSPTGSATLTVQVTYPGWQTPAGRTETITITG